MGTLRERQVECLDAIRNEYLAGCYQQLAVAATGFGKAVIIANIKGYMADLLPGKLLVFAHREELIEQLIETMREWNPGLKVGKEMAEDYCDVDCDIVVSCNASIGRSGAVRLARFGAFDIVVCDEAHHSIASTYLNVFEQTEVLKPYSTKLLVGFTATPKRKNLTRGEKKNLTLLDDEELVSLKSVYKKIVFNYPIRKAIKEGWLVPLRGFRFKTNIDLSTVKRVAGDYQQDELSTAVNTPERNRIAAEMWLKHCERRQSVGFCAGIQHAKDAAKAMRDLGIKAEAIWGVDPERASKLKRHQDEDITVLFNDKVLTEGYDDWRVSCIIGMAPTANPSKYTQEIGRGTRLQKGAGNLLEALQRGLCLTKQDCIVLDGVDNNKRCSLVTLPTLVGLNPDMDLQGESLTEVAEKIEALQEKYPTIDLSQIVDVKHIDTYIESIDMFAAPYTEEVKEFSKLTWMGCSDGSYLLSIPESKELTDAKAYSRFIHEKLHITPNDLDEFVLSITSTTQDKQLGIYNSLKEAFESADEVMQRCRPSRMKLVLREAEWHAQPATEPAKKLLRTLSKDKAVLYCLCPVLPENKFKTRPQMCPVCRLATNLTAGQASTAITLLKARKGK